jgi:small subunit ribosomal protein S8
MITSTDPIADMLSRVRNAIAVRKHTVNMPHSTVKESVARLLQANNFIDRVVVEDVLIGKTKRKTLVLTINDQTANARITEINRLSKPGRRHYVGADKIPVVKRGRGIIIISTSKGMMTGDAAKKAGIGGELICKVY